jgi:hypothetical protein
VCVGVCVCVSCEVRATTACVTKRMCVKSIGHVYIHKLKNTNVGK